MLHAPPVTQDTDDTLTEDLAPCTTGRERWLVGAAKKAYRLDV